jgi:chromosome segregation ATPase
MYVVVPLCVKPWPLHVGCVMMRVFKSKASHIGRVLTTKMLIYILAVTLDGAVIHKSGLMTGGTLQTVTRRWEEREVEGK